MCRECCANGPDHAELYAGRATALGISDDTSATIAARFGYCTGHGILVFAASIARTAEALNAFVATQHDVPACFEADTVRGAPRQRWDDGLRRPWWAR